MRRLLIPAVLTLVLAIAPSARANSSRTFHYLAVGVSKYAAGNHLQFGHKDAMDLAKIWRAQQGKLFGRVEGQTLTDGEATLTRIMQGLDRLVETTKAGDIAVVSLSGHGGFGGIRDPNWYFLPHDFKPGHMVETSLSTSTLRAKLTSLSQRGATVILILDSCHSGGYGGSEGNIVVLASCMPHQESREPAILKNGVYTRALVEALSGLADTDRDGAVTLAELDAYVTFRVPQLLQQHSGGQARVDQHPTSAKPTFVQNGMALAQVAVTVRP